MIADASCAAAVALDGGASWDADGDPSDVHVDRTVRDGLGATASVSLPAGAHLITLTVRDGRGGSSSDAILVTVVDATPPVIQSATASPSVLRKANRFVAVTTTERGGRVRRTVHCQITSVASNEPVNGYDWVITGDLTVDLRAERSNHGTGRIYTITIACTDEAGNSSTKAVTVTVPRHSTRSSLCRARRGGPSRLRSRRNQTASARLDVTPQARSRQARP